YNGVSSTDDQRRAVGYLAYHAAVSLDMDFESHGSTSNVNQQPAALNNYFRFSGHYETRFWGSFWTRMKENINAGMPVLLSIKDVDGGGAGHALVADGYRISDGKFHLNWGWHNTNNGWYDIEGSWNGTGSGYDRVEGAVFDILPDPEITEITRTAVEREFTLKWRVSDKLPSHSFSIEQQYNGGSWSEIANTVTAQELAITVIDPGTYNYRVRAKVNGNYYYNSYSEEMSVLVKDDIIALDFDGNDSYNVADVSNKLDVQSEYTIETWFNVRGHTSGAYEVLLDRKIVFSLTLINDSNPSADYALSFLSRSTTDGIREELNTVNSSAILKYDTWHHVAISRSGTTTRMFIDGNLIKSSSTSNFYLNYTSNKLRIGARYYGTTNGYERHLNGKLDGISISKVGKYTSNFVPDILVNYPVDANT
ncbi:MAG: C10 family peptidase, partial [Chlamydiia bacterium]|nr:C10 family peptidase [Chlamydiia bacterium]